MPSPTPPVPPVPPVPPPPPTSRASTDAERRRFRSTLVRVLAVQAVTLLLLWLIHARYHVS